MSEYFSKMSCKFIKQILFSGAVLTPLMSGFEMNNAQIVAAAHHVNGNGTLDGTIPPSMVMDMGGGPGVSDPVELRRLNFQTPGMMSHPPIPIMDLAAHIEDLKSEDNLKFSAEYESIGNLFFSLKVCFIYTKKSFIWCNKYLKVYTLHMHFI